MMKQSAGILLFREEQGETKFFLVHPGGPFFIKKDAGWWTVPKGEFTPPEEALAAAIREFEEETGYRPAGEFLPLSPVTQKGGKRVQCWAVAGDLDAGKIVSNTFMMEWPPHSGKQQSFPEVDKAGWFAKEDALRLINERQRPFIEEAIALLAKR